VQDKTDKLQIIVMHQEKQPAVYIMTNKINGVLYTGVTSNLIQRVYQHKKGLVEGFTKKYECKILVYYKLCGTMESAILEEKRIKAGSRIDKVKLIEEQNKFWNDLYPEILA